MHYLKNKYFIGAIVFILLCFLQFIVFQNTFSSFVMPNLVLVCIIIVSIYFDYALASIFALFGGILIDSTNNLFFGSSPLILLLAIFLIQLIKHFNKPNIVTTLLLVFFFTFFYDLSSNLLLDIFILKIDFVANLRLTLISSIENIIITFLFLKIFNTKELIKKYNA